MITKSGGADPVRTDLDNTANIATLAEALRDAIGTLVRKTRAGSHTATDVQSQVLAHLARSGPASVATLADMRGVKHQSMRLVTARLETLALIEISANPDDRRGNLVSLTDKGRSSVLADQTARSDYLAERIQACLDNEEQLVLNKAVMLMAKLNAVDSQTKVQEQQ